MGWILGLLGGALVVTIVLLARAASVHRRFRRSPGTFRCMVRAPHGGVAHVPVRWPARRGSARWVHDVLLVKRGLFREGVVALPVRLPEDAPRVAWRGDVRGLGRQPVVLSLRLDGGEVVEIAAPATARTQLVGPFLAAAIPGLPEAQVERRGAID